MKRKQTTAALLAAALLFSGCANEIGSGGKTSADSSSQNSSSLADSSSSKAEVTGGTSVSVTDSDTSDSAETTADTPKKTDKQGISPPDDGGKLNVLLSTDSSINADQIKEKYEALGGEVKYSYCSTGVLFNMISAAQLADNPVDIASFDNGLMYPYGISENMIEPMDMALNLNSERWKPYMDNARLFALNGWHYVLPINVRAAYGLYYYADTVRSATGIDPEELVRNNAWTNNTLDEMLKTWHDGGRPYGLAGWYGQPMMIATGKTLVGFDENTSGFYNNCFDWDILNVATELYALKANEHVSYCPYGDPVKALDNGAMFYSGTMFEGDTAEERDQLRCVPMPTFDGAQHYYQAYVDGLVLVKGIKNTDSARCWLECLSECDNSFSGKYSETYALPDSKAVYSYGMGISPKASTDASLSGGFPMAIVPFIYSAPYDSGEWDSVCAYFANPLTGELTVINNKIRKIYGD